MNVHIISNRIDDDWIIARLARHLIERNGWGWGRKPQPKADANVFFPYLEWRKSHWKRTPTAAWMTHRRHTTWGQKVWEQTARGLSLRVTPAWLYAKQLERYGLTAHIPHPVELKKFRLRQRERPWPRQMTVGVAGTVYRDGRKGEGLVRKLLQDGWDMRGAGKGWPCPTQWYTWDDLPNFYHSLDVFLCTSLIEGGPVTVLEALACGLPVVIPSRVGQCDEYPERPGIRHYRAGDYEDMLRALKRVRIEASGVPPEHLRHVVLEYTPERYAQEWREAIEKLIGGDND